MGIQGTNGRLLALKLLDTVVDALESLASRARSNPSRQFEPKTLKARQDSCDRVAPNMIYVSHLLASFFLIPEESSFNGSRDLTLRRRVA